MTNVSIGSALVLTVALTACSSEESPKDDSHAEHATAGSEGSSSSSSASGSARDLGALDLCAQVPVASVAQVLGQTPSTGTADATIGKFATDCTYNFRNGDTSTYVIIWAYPLEFWSLESGDDVEMISGLGDAAFQSTSDVFTEVHVLLEGDIYFEARAETPEHARALAKLALERLVS